ncbi:hypothetical protein FH609_013620 [Streptomyces sp. 3MP-14]|uniref:Uncharacterized protein n=1 Tax=Streptomyces mimosae TaxID=2586635 RepID=A0A5N6A614_9ACTN|nr:MULTISPECIES: hypothetical protein [Streptomyces]KAB8164244.1 hypothetical protein FH607_016510 [Streptomyces mimosae]KAB8176521.1 hypothetical protein FH609_013620 [Streptomyces sp. 3MP-14]
MRQRDESEPELTPQELALLENPGEVRGYTPYDGVPEPSEAPGGPASTSPAGAGDEERPPPTGPGGGPDA